MVVEGDAIMMNDQSTEPDSRDEAQQEENRRLTPQKENVELGLEFNKDFVEVQQEENDCSSSDSSHASDNEESDSDNSFSSSSDLENSQQPAP